MEKLKSVKNENNILSLTWPIFIELVLQMLVGNADQIMVGWYDPDLVGAIGNANQIVNLLLIVFSVICTAATILISQYLGAKSTERLRETYTVSLLANLIFGLAVSAILVFLCGPIYRMMSVPEEIFDEAVLYIRIIGAGMVLQAVYLTFTAFFRSCQLMKQTMLVSVLVNVMNIGCNALLINGLIGLPALGVAGAAISSGLSRLVGVVVIAMLFRRYFGKGAISVSCLKPFPKTQIRGLLHIGIPSGGESISYNLSQICIQAVCNRFELFVINTRVYANMFAMLSYMFASAVAQAAQVVVARYMGGGDTEATDKCVRRTMYASVVISGLVSVLIYIFAEPLCGIFTSDARVIALAKTIMLIEIPLELGRAVNIVMCRALQACGDIRFPITICVISAWLTAFGGGMLLSGPLGLGLEGIWIAMACDECLRAGLFLWRWHTRTWSHIRLAAAYN